MNNLFDNQFLEDIKNRTPDILDHVLRRSPDGNFICPFCGNGSNRDGTGINVVKNNPQVVKCFKCGDSWNIFQIIKHVDGCNFNEAVLKCCNILGWQPAYLQQQHSKFKKSKSAAPPAPVNKPHISPDKDLSDYIADCQNFIEDQRFIDYMQYRGLYDLDLIYHFRIGFDPKCSCVVIPHDNNFCTRRRADLLSDKKRFYYINGTHAKIFNPNALKNDIIFVTEGAIDALSIIKAGGNAIALGSAGNAKLLIDKVANIIEKKAFVILFDDDEGGNHGAEALVKGLYDAAMYSERVFVPKIDGNTKTDANDLLVHDFDKLKDFVAFTINDVKLKLNSWVQPNKRTQIKNTYAPDIGAPQNTNNRKNKQLEDKQKLINSCILKLDKIKSESPPSLTQDTIDSILAENAFNDDAMASLFADTYINDVKFNINTNSWFIWKDCRWIETPGTKNNTLLFHKLEKISQYLYQQSKLNVLSMELTKIQMGYDPFAGYEWKVALKNLKRSEELLYHHRFLSILNLAKGKMKLMVYDDQFNADIFKFNCKNGILNLKTGTFNSIHNREDLISLTSNCEYNQNTACHEWDQFVESALPDEEVRVYVQKYLGLALTGDIIHHSNTFLFLLGKGGTGKSTFIETIANVFGDYAGFFDIEQLTESRVEKTGDEPTPQLYSLRQKRLAISTETKKNRRLDCQKIKKWTGGDTLSARSLYNPKIDFKPQMHLVLVGNFAPSIEDVTDSAIVRRLRIVEFNQVPKNENEDLKEIFAQPENKSYILQWLINGYLLALKDRENGIKTFSRDNVPAGIKSALNKYYSTNDNVKTFLDDQDLKFGENKSINISTLYEVYVSWTKRFNERTLRRQDFVNMVLLLYGRKYNIKLARRRDNNRQCIFRGFGLT